jgi:two-component system LytT family response regulator
MIKVLLIDDEPLARSMVAEYLADFPQFQIMAECNDGFEGAKAIMTHAPDLIFLDIQMPKITGFEMLELLEDRPATIFTTAFDHYAIQAFEQHAIDYLLKPISKTRFQQAIRKFLDQRIANTKTNHQALLDQVQTPVQPLERILVKHGQQVRILPVDTVLFLEADDDYVKIHVNDGVFLKNKTMAYFEAHLLTQDFVRIHRSYMVRIADITKIEPYEKDAFVCVLTNGVKLPVSKTGYARLKQVLGM